MIKLFHNNLLLGIHDALRENFCEKNKVAHRVLEQLFLKNKKWGKQDRSIVSEIFYDIVRWKRRLEYFVGEELNQENIFKIIYAYLLWKEVPHKDFTEFSNLDKLAILNKIAENNFPTKAIEFSIPDDLATVVQNELGENWETEMQALNQQATTVLRANTLKTNPLSLRAILKEINVETRLINGYPDALEMSEKKNILRSDAFKKGYFEVQDASSQLVAAFLDVRKDNFVIDACAGNGGKSLHLAALMNNTGKILSMDIHKRKLQELSTRAERAGATNITTSLIAEAHDYEKWIEKADRLLIDAPCSGLGVLKRNPDAKWKMTPKLISEIKETQQSILQNYSKMLKVGGKMVYATCSILPSENSEQVTNFLSFNSNFTLLKERTIFPSAGYDGFYMALLQRNI